MPFPALPRRLPWPTLSCALGLALLLVLIQGRPAADARRTADDELRKRLRQYVFRATAEHEIGHTFGLRHNFEASFDMMNYFDPYYDPDKGRENNAAIWKLAEDGSTCLGGRVPVNPSGGTLCTNAIAVTAAAV